MLGIRVVYVMPHLFGPLGKTSIGGNLIRVMCLRKEFRLMSRDRSSPIADWIRALHLLCRHRNIKVVLKALGYWHVSPRQFCDQRSDIDSVHQVLVKIRVVESSV